MSHASEHRIESSQERELPELAHALDAEHQPEVSRKASMAGLRQIQQKAGAEAGRKGGELQGIAARGVESPTTALPHAEKIQAAFGAHDVSKIQAHVGGTTAAEMGANAYASGQHVVFDRQPDLHTAAHEAAHVVQQARGVNLYGGVGEAGDKYEQQADAVADRVVAGQSAADLLGAPAGQAEQANAAPGSAVQLDKGTAKLADASDAERKEARGHAEVESAGAMGTTLELVTRKMFAASKHIERMRRSSAQDEGGRFKVMDAMRQEAKDIQGDLVMLELFLAGFETKFTGDKDKDNHINGAHRLYADKLRQFKRAYNEYRIAYYQAKDYGGKDDPIGTRDLDSDVFNNLIRPIFEKFDLKYDDVQAVKLDFADAETRTFDDAATKKLDKITAELLNKTLKDNLDAAEEHAKVLRMEAKAGTKTDRSTDARRLAAHVRELAHVLEDLDKAQRKTHKPELKALVKEIEAVQLELAGHEEVKSVLMNPAGTFGGYLDKVRAALR